MVHGERRLVHDRREILNSGEGFTLVEVVAVMLTMGVLAAIAFPSLARALARAKVGTTRDVFFSAHSLARLVARQYGRNSELHVDPLGSTFWVTIDTASLPGLTRLDTIGPVIDVGEQFGVKLISNRRLLCFNTRGLGTPAGACELPNATIVFSIGTVADTATISRLGRLRKR